MAAYKTKALVNYKVMAEEDANWFAIVDLIGLNSKNDSDKIMETLKKYPHLISHVKDPTQEMIDFCNLYNL